MKFQRKFDKNGREEKGDFSIKDLAECRHGKLGRSVKSI